MSGGQGHIESVLNETAPGQLKWCMRHAYLIVVLLVICCMNRLCMWHQWCACLLQLCNSNFPRNVSSDSNKESGLIVTVYCSCLALRPSMVFGDMATSMWEGREVIVITLNALLFYNVCIGLGTRPSWFPDIMIQGQLYSSPRLYQVENGWARASWGRTESRIPRPDWDRYFHLINSIPRPVLSTDVQLQQHF